MKQKRISWYDIQIIALFVTQFMILGPLLAVLIMVVDTRQFGSATFQTVMNVVNITSVLSLFACVYGMNVLIGVAESCSHVSQQRPALTAAVPNENSDGLTQEPKDDTSESKPKKNLANKMAWIIFITGFPALCTAFLPCFITSDYYVEAGGVLTRVYMELHWSGLINIFFAFFGSLRASKAFPSDDNLLIPIEWFSARVLEAELVPAFVLDYLSRAYAKIVEDRRSKGMDINLGVSFLNTEELNIA
jgi:hypothetical protein